MTNEDEVLLRDLAAFFAMNGLLANGDYHPDEIPAMSYKIADGMVEARDGKKAGLPAIYKRRSK
jgi:hypothetical protein